MAKYVNYYPKDKEYQEIIDYFIDMFIGRYGENIISKDELRSTLQENIKKIQKHESVINSKLLGYLKGQYNNVSCILMFTELLDEEDNTLIHEMFHALVRKHYLKRVKFLDFSASLLFNQKQLNSIMLEEGMTEYFTSQLFDANSCNLFGAYSQQVNIVDKLVKIYGEETVFRYYIFNDSTLIDRINETYPGGIKAINYLTHWAGNIDAHGSMPTSFFEPVQYYKGKKIIQDNTLFEVYERIHMKEVNTIEDFRYNAKKIFLFYKTDLENFANSLAHEQELYDVAVKNDASLASDFLLKKEIDKFNTLDGILRSYFKKLKIDDDYLYNEIIEENLKELDDYTYEWITFYISKPIKESKTSHVSDEILSLLDELEDDYQETIEEEHVKVK